MAGHKHRFDDRLPTLQPKPNYMDTLQPNSDQLKDMQKLIERREPLTVIIGAKCRDGILMLSDAQFTDSDYHITYDSKLFAFPHQDGANYVVGLAGFKHAFNYVRHQFSTEFINPDDNNSRQFDRFECEERVKTLSDRIYHYYHVARTEASGNKDRFPDPVIGGVFAARVFDRGVPELLLYNFSPYYEPDDQEYHTAGSGAHDADAVYNFVKYILKRLDLEWSILSMKLVGQIMMFAMRYVSSLNISVSSNYKIITLTKEEGSKGRLQNYFYPKHFEENVPYKNELMATLLEVLPDDKAQKLLDKLRFT